MRFPRPILRFFLCCCLMAGGIVHATAQNVGVLHGTFDARSRSFSFSKMFVVYSDQPELRILVASFAEDVKNSFDHALGLRDIWKHQIVITLRSPSVLDSVQPPSSLNLYQTDTGISIQLDLVLGESAQQVELRDEITRALLLELAARPAETIPGGVQYRFPPNWLVSGFSAIKDRREASVNVSVFQKLLKSGIRYDAILGLEPKSLDSTSKSIFRLYSKTMVQMLLDQPGGKADMLRFIEASSRFTDNGLSEIPAFFEGVKPGSDSFEKEWMLTLARHSTGDRSQILSPQATVAQLQKALFIHVPAGALDPKKKEKDAEPSPAQKLPLSEFEVIAKLKQKEREATLVEAERQLMALSGKANPLFTEIISDYQEAILRITRGRTKDLAARIAELDTTTGLLAKRGSQMDDYLNWYEATQMMVQSSDFDGYFQTLKTQPKQTFERKDAISVYLDAVEAELQ